MSAVFARTALRDCPDLFTRVVRFNQHPATTLHTDHLLPLPPGERAGVRGVSQINPHLFNRLLQSPRAERQLSAWVIKHHGLSPTGFWRFEYPPQRLAILDPPHLESLIRFTAATAITPRIIALIGGAQLREAKQSLGDDAYQFALKRASLVAGPKPIETDLPPDAPLTAANITATGLAWLRTCLGNDSPELLKRTSLKLPAAWAITPETRPASIDRDRCWKILKRILLTEIAPDLAPCFN
ncbi:MAG TPA: SctK family type III secretion system sorting platform protein [Caulifigura sp.]|nr:SctK family type III secretion system sorting platform protein [Caulifigura sp.]